MRLGIMQPYFFPYLGHFALIGACDRWVVFDVTQYTPKSWISRNRVLHPQQGWNYISAALSNGSINVRINEARIQDFAHTRQSVLGKLTHYRKAAPGYRRVMACVEEVFAEPVEFLVELNIKGLEVICRELGLSFQWVRASGLEFNASSIQHPGAWAPAISQSLGATQYLNPVGGASLFRAAEFEATGVELQFLQYAVPGYATGPYVFEPGLSVLDALMWNPPEMVAAWVRQGRQILAAQDVLPELPAQG